MINAKQELLEILKDKSPIKCIYLYKDKKEIILKENYTQYEYDNFLSMLDFDYIKNLHGTVWLKDGTWLSRCNHNGLEWWDYNICPDIHNKCLSDKHSIKKDKHKNKLTIVYKTVDSNEKIERKAKISINNPFLKHIIGALDNLSEIENGWGLMLDNFNFNYNFIEGNINIFQNDLLCLLIDEYVDDDDEYVDDAYSNFLEKYNYELTEKNIKYLEEFNDLFVSDSLFTCCLAYKGYKLK